MTTYTGGDTVKAGFYWNRGKLGAEVIAAEGGTLPGGDNVHYAPAMGGAFAMFLPFLGLAMLANYAFGAVTGRGEAHGHARP
jgi:hypothetical protein